VVNYLRMKITHLRIILHAKGIIQVSSNSQTQLIYSYYPISGWSLKHMQLNHIFLRCQNNFELAQPHLEHHILFEHYFLPHHQKGPSSGANIPNIELRPLSDFHALQAA
jgi:hypothetical protein